MYSPRILVKWACTHTWLAFLFSLKMSEGIVLKSASVRWCIKLKRTFIPPCFIKQLPLINTIQTPMHAWKADGWNRGIRSLDGRRDDHDLMAQLAQAQTPGASTAYLHLHIQTLVLFSLCMLHYGQLFTLRTEDSSPLSVTERWSMPSLMCYTLCKHNSPCETQLRHIIYVPYRPQW